MARLDLIKTTKQEDGMSEVYTNVNEQSKNIDINIIEQLSKSTVISKCNFNYLAEHVSNNLAAENVNGLRRITLEKSESFQLKKNGIMIYVTCHLLSDHDTLISYLMSKLNNLNSYIENLIFTGNITDTGYKGILKGGILTEKIKSKFKIFLTKKSILKLLNDISSEDNNSEFYVSPKTCHKLIKRGLITDGKLHGRKINVVEIFGNRLIVLADLTQYNIFLKSKNFDCRFSDIEGAYRFTFRSFGFMSDYSSVRVLKYWF